MMYFLGRWEHNLTISEANHEFVQVILVLIIFSWVYLWNSLDEQDVFSRYLSPKNKDIRANPDIVLYMDQGIPINSSCNSENYSYIKKD